MFHVGIGVRFAWAKEADDKGGRAQGVISAKDDCHLNFRPVLWCLKRYMETLRRCCPKSVERRPTQAYICIDMLGCKTAPSLSSVQCCIADIVYIPKPAVSSHGFRHEGPQPNRCGLLRLPIHLHPPHPNPLTISNHDSTAAGAVINLNRRLMSRVTRLPPAN